MNLQRFRYFAMVVAEGSFSRAADKLHMSQPPLSRQISSWKTKSARSCFIAAVR
jgi:DNA-binding transcriptional LysR family regulator